MEELLIQNEELIHSYESFWQSESRLQQAEKAAKIGHWTLQLDTKTMIASKGAEAIYGANFQMNSLAEVQEITLPEYRLFLDKALSDPVTHQIHYDLEFKIRRPCDGALVHIHSGAVFDKKTHTVFGVVQDMTAQKKA